MDVRGKIGRFWHGLAVFCAIAVCLAQLPAHAVETDQFLVWDRELRDSAEPLNRFFNEEIQSLLAERNLRRTPFCECSALADDILDHFFKKRRTSCIKMFLRNSEEVELYPDRSLSNLRYRNMSIYRDLTFPYVIPLARTVRVGEVYFGIDKFGHMFGFGSRYYQRYIRYIGNGATEEEAIARVVRFGILMEKVLVGEYFDGVFAYADLEANYQGFMLARDMCHGSDPLLVFEDGQWRLTRPVDLRTYITPDFDESYNLSHWQADRKREVLVILREEYFEKRKSQRVQDRFNGYRLRPPSASRKAIEKFFENKGVQPQLDQSLTAFDAPPGNAVVVVAEDF